MRKRISFVLMVVLLSTLVNFAPERQAAKALSLDVVISQVYGGGGNTGAEYTHDFIELFNRGANSVSLAGWSIQYASATGTGNFGSNSTMITELPNITLQPGQYFLVQEIAGAGGDIALPTPDLIDQTPIVIAAIAGKVALVNSTTPLGCNGGSSPCNAQQEAKIIDLIGWGTANYYENAPAPGTSNTTAVIRKLNGCKETDDNSADFFVGAPNPRNSASPIMICPPERPVINEFSVNTVGEDLEYIEFFALPNTDYSAYTLIGMEGDAESNIGTIHNVIPLGVTDEYGFFLVNLPSNTLENGTLSLLLVKDFTGSLGEDLDPENGSDLESTPWGEIVDQVAIYDGGVSDITYGMVVLEPFYDGIGFVPGGASRIPNGFNSHSASDWVRNDFDLAGIPGYTGTPELGEALNTPGAANQLYVPPVEAAPQVINTAPVMDAINVDPDAMIVITFSEPVTVSGTWFDITCTKSGSHTATVQDADPVYTLTPHTPFALSETCTVTIFGAQVSDDDDDDPPDVMESNYVFSFTTIAAMEACGDPYTPIYLIQGEGPFTPFQEQEMVTEGVVVGDFQTNVSVQGSKNGFFIQDPIGDGNPATSDGIFVYSTLVDVQPGDRVRVRGKVHEYVTGTSSLTEFYYPTQVWICSSGHSVAATQLPLPVSLDFDFEAYEGMLVTLPQPLVISEIYNFDRYGELVLTSQRHLAPTSAHEPGSPGYQQAVQNYLLDRIILDDGRNIWYADPALHPNGQEFDLNNRFRAGDVLEGVTGILDSYESQYRLQPAQGAVYTLANPRPAVPALSGDLQIASFNVLNYFLTIDTGAKICGPLGNMECRGADNAEELTRQRAKILAAMSAINADIYGLMEIQNDQDQSVADLAAGMNEFFGPGAYSYIATGFIGGDAIKQAIVYKTASVTPLGDYAILDSSVDPRFLDAYNRPVLAQSFLDLSTGLTFTVAVNHLKSKGSNCNAAGDPDLGDGQGNCNLTRKAAAEAMVDWLAIDPTGSGAGKNLIIGDLNAYAREDPVGAILNGPDDLRGSSDDYTDLVHTFVGEGAYSYLFDGQIGYLDHALASPGLVDHVVGVTIWHINADEPDLLDYNLDFMPDLQRRLYAPDAYRSSDHDPVIVSLSMDMSYTANADAYSTLINTPLMVPAPGVMGNDSPAQPDDSLTVQLKTGPEKGILILHTDGAFTYYPEAGFTGQVTFVYELVSANKGGVVAQGTATILVEKRFPVYLPLLLVP